MQEAFAVVREASKRVLGLRPFDVQLIGRTGICYFIILYIIAYRRVALTRAIWCVTVYIYIYALGKNFINVVSSGVAGGMVLHKGEIAEMRTGEGKTLVAILPAYLNALSGKGVHVVTVNDYLARRDCEWVGQVPRFLGMKVGLIQRMSHASFLPSPLCFRNLSLYLFESIFFHCQSFGVGCIESFCLASLLSASIFISQ